jgi:hypothetical protein
MIEGWLAAIRDDLDRPPPDQVLVLAMLALRLDWKTGAGYTSDRQLAFDADAGERTVQRATRWARTAGYAARTRRGHRLWRGGIAASEWKLSQPDTHDRLRTALQPDTRDGLKGHATRQPKGRTTRQSSPYNPTPEQHHQESSTSRTKSDQFRWNYDATTFRVKARMACACPDPNKTIRKLTVTGTQAASTRSGKAA